MQAAGIIHVELLLLAILFLVAALAVLAKRVAVPYPIILVIGGLILSALPGAPRVELEPNIVFLVFLPPLLFSAAFHTSWREFKRNLVSILLLAFGLVGFTVFGVALVTRWILPGFDWQLGLVLGAVVATTDPISAVATARKLGIPRRISDLLEAESLLNDGSGLVALRFTAALVVTGVTPTFLQGVGQLFYLISAGIAIGLVVAYLISRIQRSIAESSIEITISLITPYVAYLAAESAHCSGIMATLACGIYLGRQSSGFYSLHARVESSAFWRTLDFILNGIVFLVLGLQLPSILADIEGLGIGNMALDATLFCLLVVVIRLLWVFPSGWLTSKFRDPRIARHVAAMPPRALFILGWSGMRGVLALAAAISLPERLSNGQPFPQRNLIIFLTFCVIFVTLVLQGLSLPALIRRLGLSGASATAEKEEEETARKQMISAAMQAIAEMREQEARNPAVLDHLEHFYQRRLALITEQEQSESNGIWNRREVREYDDLSYRLRSIERQVALRLRDEHKIHDEVLREIERELDLLDVRFGASSTADIA